MSTRYFSPVSLLERPGLGSREFAGICSLFPATEYDARVDIAEAETRFKSCPAQRPSSVLRHSRFQFGDLRMKVLTVEGGVKKAVHYLQHCGNALHGARCADSMANKRFRCVDPRHFRKVSSERSRQATNLFDVTFRSRQVSIDVVNFRRLGSCDFERFSNTTLYAFGIGRCYAAAVSLAPAVCITSKNFAVDARAS